MAVLNWFIKLFDKNRDGIVDFTELLALVYTVYMGVLVFRATEVTMDLVFMVGLGSLGPAAVQLAQALRGNNGTNDTGESI